MSIFFFQTSNNAGYETGVQTLNATWTGLSILTVFHPHGGDSVTNYVREQGTKPCQRSLAVLDHTPGLRFPKA